MKFLNIAAYRFFAFENTADLREPMRTEAILRGIRGTILLTPEGINLFLAGEENALREYMGVLRSQFKIPSLEIKESWSDKNPFTRMLVKLKKEIIAFGVAGVEPAKFTGPSVSPEELSQWLDEKRDVILLDTRNDYEVAAGTFEKAHDPNIKTFKEFISKADEFPDEWKEKTVVMFCTGGIRCEKASPFLIGKGFKNVYQLEGGILKYFEKVGQKHYTGDCFVFDWRMAVDSKLSATTRKEGRTADKYFNPEIARSVGNDSNPRSSQE